MQTISSREVAEMLGKRHDNFMRDLRKYIASLGDKSTEYFIEGSYEDSSKKKRFCYEITVKGLDLIASRIPLAKSFIFRENIKEKLGEDVIQKEISSQLNLSNEPEEKFYTADEVASILGCSERNVYRNIQSGKLEAVEREILVPQVKKMISEEALEKYKKERGIK